jgi:hypothetical protein
MSNEVAQVRGQTATPNCHASQAARTIVAEFLGGFVTNSAGFANVRVHAEAHLRVIASTKVQ